MHVHMKTKKNPLGINGDLVSFVVCSVQTTFNYALSRLALDREEGT